MQSRISRWQQRSKLFYTHKMLSGLLIECGRFQRNDSSRYRVPVSPTHWSNITRWCRWQHRFGGKCRRFQQQVPPNRTKSNMAMVTILLAIDNEHQTIAFQMLGQNARAREHLNSNNNYGRPEWCDQFIESVLKPFKIHKTSMHHILIPFNVRWSHYLRLSTIGGI